MYTLFFNCNNCNVTRRYKKNCSPLLYKAFESNTTHLGFVVKRRDFGYALLRTSYINRPGKGGS